MVQVSTVGWANMHRLRSEAAPNAADQSPSDADEVASAGETVAEEIGEAA